MGSEQDDVTLLWDQWEVQHVARLQHQCIILQDHRPVVCPGSHSLPRPPVRQCATVVTVLECLGLVVRAVHMYFIGNARHIVRPAGNNLDARHPLEERQAEPHKHVDDHAKAVDGAVHVDDEEVGVGGAAHGGANGRHLAANHALGKVDVSLPI